MEVLRRDVRLRNGDIELELDRQHQIHHFQGAYPQIAQLPIDRKRVRGGRIRPKRLFHESDELLPHPLKRLRIHSIPLLEKPADHTVHRGMVWAMRLTQDDNDTSVRIQDTLVSPSHNIVKDLHMLIELGMRIELEL